MSGIFLHAGWRSSGTWLWEKLRVTPGYMGFYEPLHEALPRMPAAKLNSLVSTDWPSRHPELSRPYFAEYAPLLRRRGGVEGASLSFSFDRFYLGARDRHDSLKAYVSQLCDAAARAGKQPVLKFTRSQGRLPWFAAQFPDMRHVLVVRQPWAQFRSGWRCLAEHSNVYFAAMPFLVLERNAAHPAVESVTRALGLDIQPGIGPLRWRFRRWHHDVRGLAPQTLYRACFALWLLNVLHALPAAPMVLDGDADPAEMAAPLGLDLPRAQRPAAATLGFRPLNLAAADIRETHDLARAALRRLPDPALSARLEGWMLAAERQAARDLAQHVEVRVPAPMPGLLRRAAGRLKWAA